MRRPLYLAVRRLKDRRVGLPWMNGRSGSSRSTRRTAGRAIGTSRKPTAAHGRRRRGTFRRSGAWACSNARAVDRREGLAPKPRRGNEIRLGRTREGGHERANGHWAPFEVRPVAPTTFPAWREKWSRAGERRAGDQVRQHLRNCKAIPAYEALLLRSPAHLFSCSSVVSVVSFEVPSDGLHV